jgi:hypothetical protein
MPWQVLFWVNLVTHCICSIPCYYDTIVNGLTSWINGALFLGTMIMWTKWWMLLEHWLSLLYANHRAKHNFQWLYGQVHYAARRNNSFRSWPTPEVLLHLLLGLGSVHIHRRGQLIKMMLKLELIMRKMKESTKLKARQNQWTFTVFIIINLVFIFSWLDRLFWTC